MTFSINDTQHNSTSTITLSVIMLNVAFYLCRYAEFSYAECLIFLCRYAEFSYAECRILFCRYAECSYAECRGVHKQSNLFVKCIPFCSLKCGSMAFSIASFSINNKNTQRKRH